MIVVKSKRLLLMALAVVFTLTASASLRNFTGCVKCGGKGVAGVAVTDGYSVVRTDKRGRYTLAADTRAQFVYLSMPSGYKIPMANNMPCIYKNITDEDRRYDFEIEQDPVDQSKHLYVVWADSQVFDETEVHYIDTAAADLKELVESYGQMSATGNICGDITGEIYQSQFVPVKDKTAASGVPFFYTIGNHDMDQDARSNELSKHSFHDMFGPNYYSYNRGKIHYVVLDNCFFVARGYSYIGYLDEAQLAWLEQDLASVEAGSTVFVTMHIPAFSQEARRAEWGKEQFSQITTNRSWLFKMLEPYNTHIFSAHKHYAENYVISDKVFEHVHAPLSGLFWQSLWSMDGVPWGYYVYEVDGDNVEWYYKPIGSGRDNQFSAYAVGQDPMKMDCVTVNVWNYDPAWRVEWFEDGVAKGAMTQYTGYDPTICRDVEERRDTEFRWNYIGAGPTEHFFFARPSSADAKVEILITDRFGYEYKWSSK